MCLALTEGYYTPAEPLSQGDREPLQSRMWCQIYCEGRQVGVGCTYNVSVCLCQNGEGCLQVPIWFCSWAENSTTGIQRNNKRSCKSRTEDVPLGEMRSDCLHLFSVEDKCAGEFIVTTLRNAAEWLKTSNVTKQLQRRVELCCVSRCDWQAAVF